MLKALTDDLCFSLHVYMSSLPVKSAGITARLGHEARSYSRAPSFAQAAAVTCGLSEMRLGWA